MPAILNAANEIAVAAFLAGRLRFPEITAVVATTMNQVSIGNASTVEAVIAADSKARERAQALIVSLAEGGREVSWFVPS